MVDRVRSICGTAFFDDEMFELRHAMLLSITFDEPLDRKRMSEALSKAAEVCPYMAFSAEKDEKGILYFTKNDSPVRFSEALPDRLGGEETDGHLFCLIPKGNELFFYCHHALTDAAGMIWFIDALLNSYYGSESFIYKGAGKPDACTDLMEKPIPVQRELQSDSLLPKDFFRFPKAAEGKHGQLAYKKTFPKRRFEMFMAERNCTETAALWTIVLSAVQRAYPENDRPIVGRSPVDVRKLFGVKNTFQNASLSQIIIKADPKEINDTDSLIDSLHSSIAKQTNHDDLAFYINAYAKFLRDGDKEHLSDLLAVFTLPFCISYLGEVIPKAAAAHVKAVDLRMDSSIPFMAYLVVVGGECQLSVNQGFEDTAYSEALSAVIEELLPPLPERIEPLLKEPGSKRFMERIKEIVDTYPDRTAFVDFERRVTYRELEIESGKVYHYLKRAGIGKEDFVQIVMPRGIGTVACMGGVLRAGAAFVPLEDTYPKDRIRYIREDAGCRCVIDRALFEEIMAHEPYLGGYEETGLHDACYAIYTSGSTGNPKGVVHEYGNIDQNALAAPRADYFPERRFGLLPAFYFVGAMTFLMSQMLEADTIYIIPHELIQDFRKLTLYITENRLQSLFMSPSHIRIYEKPSPWLERIETASEPANGLYYPGGMPEIENLYGMSEAGFVVLKTVLDRVYDPAPVGKPVIPVDVHLLDEEGNRIEGEGTGELCFRDEFVRGYLNLPEKTAAAFVDGVYHTGDIAGRDKEGVYTILGRKDEMIKINGNRIEPAEIEYRIKEQTGLARVAVKGFVTSERAFIAAYFLKQEAKEKGLFSGDRLIIDREKLKTALPDYMIPAVFQGLDEFPLTSSGKLLKSALPEPESPGEGTDYRYEAPANKAEKLLCSVMEEILGKDRIGATDDFYEAGGDSINALRLLSALSDRGIEIPLGELTKRRTPRSLAPLVPEESQDFPVME
ncbi:MAG: non-ribosomal peptide synthetase [Lachnospiraceae bacterium]|nr:non-ribosomal peptide synthetase [Lachnospiraceae bacterium]